MTKEELKQEAEEYYFDRLDPKAIDSISEIANADTEDLIVSAYLAGAEPREKRISELEEENAELKRNKKTVVHLAECLEEKQREQLKEAKELIEDMYYQIPSSQHDYYKDVMERAEQFLKED